MKNNFEDAISNVSTKGLIPPSKSHLKINPGSLNNIQLPGFLVERKLSQEELIQRDEWIQTKRLELNKHSINRKHVTRKVNISKNLSGLYCATYSPNGDIIATSFGSGSIQLRKGKTGEVKTTLKSGLESSLPVTCCRFHPIKKNILFASSACGSVFICTLDKVEFWKFVEELNNEINALDVNTTGDILVTGGKDAAIRLYDTETAKKIMYFQKDKICLLPDTAVRYHHMKIFAAKCHRTNTNLIVSGGWDDTVRMWDVRVGQGSIQTINGPHICGDAIDIQDDKILTGSWVVEDAIQIWDIKTGKLFDTVSPTNREMNRKGEFIYTARFFDDDPYGNHIIVGGSGIAQVEVINIKEKKIVAGFNANKAVVTIDSHRTNIVYGGMDNKINLIEYV